jgi:ABC-2 type transport system ATP-binding protein
MSGAMLRAEGLTRRFGEFTAVDRLDLEVEKGTLFAFLGANGSGKSTTIRMLIGLLVPSAGRIEVDGVDVIRHPRRVRERIGYMGQKVSLYAGLTLRENVEFYGGLYGLERTRLRARWEAVRERFELRESESERPEDLPAGIRQRAGLALATLHEPRVLFLDEPTAGVDVHSRGLFWERIQEETDAGVTVFVTTHFLEETDYCDRVSFIEAGRLVVADATPAELRARFSGGYRVRCALAPERLAAALPPLRAAGFALEAAPPESSELVLRRASLEGAALEALRSALGAGAGAGLRIEPASMNEVFQRLIQEAAAGRRDAA